MAAISVVAMKDRTVSETATNVNCLPSAGGVSAEKNSQSLNFGASHDQSSTFQSLSPAAKDSSDSKECNDTMDVPSNHTEITSPTKEGSFSAQLDQSCNILTENIPEHGSVNKKVKEVNFNLPSIEINDYTEEAVTGHGSDDDKDEETKECGQGRHIDSTPLGSNRESGCLVEGNGVEKVSEPLDPEGIETNNSDDHNVRIRRSRIAHDNSNQDQLLKNSSVEVHNPSPLEPPESSTKCEILSDNEEKTQNKIGVTVEDEHPCNRRKQSDITMEVQPSNKSKSTAVSLDTKSREKQGGVGQVPKPLCLPGKNYPQQLKENESKSFDTNEINRQSKPTSSETTVFPSQSLPPNLSLNSHQHVETQVSLEVMCRSAATSPMTPPEGFAAAFFPYLSGKFELSCKELALVSKKDAELQVGEAVKSRSVATAPMSPITPNAPEDSYPKIDFKDAAEDNQQEPVQAVNWDEKGMTWEVYGAAVEVEVLGIAIQKHLEKQIKDHRKFPPPSITVSNSTNLAIEEAGHSVASPPSSPPPASATSSNALIKEPGKPGEKREGKKKKRLQRNPFRVAFRSLHRPRCCFRTNAIE